MQQPKKEQFRNIADFNVASYYYKIGKDYTNFLAVTKDAEDAALAAQNADGNQPANVTPDDGQGGVGDQEEQIDMYSPSNYQFDGDYILVDFNDDLNGKIYLYDRKAQTYRGFKDAQSVANYFNIEPNEVDDITKSVPSNVLSDPNWKGEILNYKYDIDQNGSSVEQPTGTQSSLGSSGVGSIYGKEKFPVEVEEWAGNLIGTIFTSVKNKDQISDDTFNETVMDSANLAKYMSALLYGGYNMGDIYREIKAQDLGIDEKGFDESMVASEWYKTPEGVAALANSSTTPSNDLLGMDSDLFKYSIFQIPGKAFSTIIEPIDVNSQEFKDEAENIQASYYDIMMQNQEASTEQEKALADNNWKMFKESLEKKYDIQLSDNSRVAWGQLKEMMSGYSERGIGQSGLLEEAMDKQLTDVRRSDQLMRDAKIDEKEIEQRNYLRASGSTQEIGAFINESAENRQKAQDWGLIPSQEILDWYKPENLKALYPDMSDEEINSISTMMVDENGFYRSNVYQNLYANKYGLGEQKKTYQQQKLYDQKLADETEAYEPWAHQNPLSSYNPALNDGSAGTNGSIENTGDGTTGAGSNNADILEGLRNSGWGGSNIPFIEGLSDAQQQSIQGLRDSGRELSEQDAKNYAYSIGDTNWQNWVGKSGSELGKATTADDFTQPKDVTIKNLPYIIPPEERGYNKSTFENFNPSNSGMRSNMPVYGIPFKEGLNKEQKNSIYGLQNSGNKLNENDAKNYAYSIGDSNWKNWIGKSGIELTLNTTPKGGTIMKKGPDVTEVKAPIIKTNTPPANNEWKTFTTGKNDVLGKNWQGYSKISGADYDTDDKRKTWGNVQSVGNSLYGYKQ